MRLIAGLAAITALGFAFAGAAIADPSGVTLKDGAFIAPDGKPLYTFARDITPGKSACNGGCAASWPALAATSTDKDAGDWTVVTRDDGAKQWAYKGKPLYTFARDTAGAAATGVSAAWPLAMK
jgi:predicted lipoprotein with Yx(FWY)xxD motif